MDAKLKLRAISKPGDDLWDIEYDHGITPLTIKLTVFDILGREVATLVNKEQNAGSYSVKFDASELTSGKYEIQPTLSVTMTL